MPEQDVGKNSSVVQNQGQTGQVSSAQAGIPVKRRRPRRRRRKNNAVIAGKIGQPNISAGEVGLSAESKVPIIPMENVISQENTSKVKPEDASSQPDFAVEESNIESLDTQNTVIYQKTDNQSVSILDPADLSAKNSGVSSLHEEEDAMDGDDEKLALEPENIPVEEENTDKNSDDESIVEEVQVSKPDEPEVIEAEEVKSDEPEKVKNGLNVADFGDRLLFFVKSLLSGIPGAAVFMGGFLVRVFRGFRLRYLFMLIFVGLVVGGGYFFVYSGLMNNTYNGVMALFVPKKEEIIEVHVSENDQRMFGINTANLFAANFGSVKDYTPNQIIVADYFGRLMEPQVKGETGITAASYFGELMDQAKDINEFVKYMENLAALQNRYKVDVYAMLDMTLKRDSALLAYLADLKAAREKSLEMYRSIKVNIDDIKLSYDSLTPDKTKYEGDFFTAMSELQPEKSDVLLKGFVDVVQKQAALKARLGALDQLAAYYENALSKLDKRISAVEQNQEALINGIRVVDVPGSGVDVIIQPQAVKN